MVYQSIERWQPHLRGNRGGQAHPLWIISLDDYGTTEVPYEGAIDTRPFWIGDTVYLAAVGIRTEKQQEGSVDFPSATNTLFQRKSFFLAVRVGF